MSVLKLDYSTVPEQLLSVYCMHMCIALWRIPPSQIPKGEFPLFNSILLSVPNFSLQPPSPVQQNSYCWDYSSPLLCLISGF